MATKPLSDLTATWNAGGTTFTAVKMNVTDTASAAGSLLMDLQVGGVSRFSVRKDGRLRIGGGDLSFNTDGSQLWVNAAGAGMNPVSFRSQTNFTLAANTVLGWTSDSSTATGGTIDTVLVRDAANTLAQRNGTNAQAFRIYNTFTDASNYERGRVAWESNTFVVGAQAAGTGTNRTTYLTSSGGTSAAQVRIGTDASGGRIWFTPANLSAWEMTSSGHFLAGVDNTYDIGASGANRPRNVHIAGYVSIGDGITAPSAETGQARIYVDTADGDLKVIFADGTIKTIVTDT